MPDLDPVSIYSGYVPYVAYEEEDVDHVGDFYFAWYKNWNEFYSNSEKPVREFDDWKVIGYKMEKEVTK